MTFQSEAPPQPQRTAFSDLRPATSKVRPEWACLYSEGCLAACEGQASKPCPQPRRWTAPESSGKDSLAQGCCPNSPLYLQASKGRADSGGPNTRAGNPRTIPKGSERPQIVSIGPGPLSHRDIPWGHIQLPTVARKFSISRGMLDSPRQDHFYSTPRPSSKQSGEKTNPHPSFHRRARLVPETHPHPPCHWQKLARQETEVGDGQGAKGESRNPPAGR